MTWVIGASPLLGGYGLMVSDIQVTFKDGNTVAILRKAYPIGVGLVAGFAGSVQIGFCLLDSLADYLKSAKPPVSLKQCPAAFVAENWQETARYVFATAREGEKALGSQFLLVGLHPVEDIGIPGRARNYICKFSSPDFVPEITGDINCVRSIGSGAEVPAYVKNVSEVLGIESGLHQSEMNPHGGWAMGMNIMLTNVIGFDPQPGISRHLHIHILERGGIIVQTNDHTTFPKDDEGEPIEFRMPVVAESYKEFISLLSAKEIISALAVC